MNDNLESINKLQKDLKSAKLVSCFLPREQRKKIKDMEKQLGHMVETISLFNRYFSGMGWCAYDSMNMELMEQSVKAYETGGIEAGEKILVEYYKTDRLYVFSFKYDILWMDKIIVKREEGRPWTII